MPRRLTNGGTSAVLPRTFETTAPNDGDWRMRFWLSLQPVMTSVSECSSTEAMERTAASLSHILAWSGKCSEIWQPGTLVLIGLNSPRYSTGALGLRSYMSMCDGPPGRLIMMTDLLVEPPLAAWRRSSSGRASPATPRAPIWRKLRRLWPSQKRWRDPWKVNMIGLRGGKVEPGGRAVARFAHCGEHIIRRGRSASGSGKAQVIVNVSMRG